MQGEETSNKQYEKNCLDHSTEHKYTAQYSDTCLARRDRPD